MNVEGSTMGWMGGILVGVLGCLGGLIGTYFSIKNTNGPREKAFVIRCVIVGWVAISIFLALLFMTPAPYRHLLWIPYGIALPLGIQYGNRKQNMIRESEKRT